MVKIPTYDFKCEECGLVKEGTMSFDESEAGIQCECEGNMVRQFTPNGNIHCKWNPPYKPGTNNPLRDQQRANRMLDEKGELPKELGGSK